VTDAQLIGDRLRAARGALTRKCRRWW